MYSHEPYLLSLLVWQRPKPNMKSQTAAFLLIHLIIILISSHSRELYLVWTERRAIHGFAENLQMRLSLSHMLPNRCYRGCCVVPVASCIERLVPSATMHTVMTSAYQGVLSNNSNTFVEQASIAHCCPQGRVSWLCRGSASP